MTASVVAFAAVWHRLGGPFACGSHKRSACRLDNRCLPSPIEARKAVGKHVLPVAIGVCASWAHSIENDHARQVRLVGA